MVVYLSALTISCFFAVTFDCLNMRCLINIKDKVIPEWLIRTPFSSQLFWLLSATAMFLPSGLRYKVGTDYDFYEQEYNLAISGGKTHYDIGFTLLNKTAKLMGGGYWLVIAISSALFIYGMWYLGSSVKDNLLLFVFLVFFSYQYFNSVSLIAQYAAIGLIAISIALLLKKKYFTSAVIVLLASSLHSSALIFMPILLLYWMLQKTSKKGRVFFIGSILIILSPILCVKFLPWLISKTRFAGYLADTSRDGYASGSYMVINFAILGALIVLCFMQKKLLKEVNFQFIFMFQLISTALSIMQWQMSMLVRLLMYFTVFQPVMLAYLVSRIENKKIRTVSYVAIAAAYLIWFFAFPLPRNIYDPLPYQSILSV